MTTRTPSKQGWGQWLGLQDEQARAEARAKREEEKRAAEDKAVVELRERLLTTEEGRLCGQQLAETGEFGRGGTAAQLVDDAFLRRWLVARDWNVDVTYKLLLNHGGWRAHVLRRGYIPEADVARPLAANTIFLPGRDREGRALIIVKVANHDARRRDLREMKLFSIYIMESMVALCDRAANPQCRLASMFDLTGCSYHNLDAAVMRNILGILSAHYVERLSVMYFYNAPAVFFAIWNASKGLLPEVTRNKIKMISPSDTSELRAWLPDDVLPAEYGGQGELLPIAAACRRFRLPPFDGLVDPSVPVPAPAHDAGGDTAAAARADGSGSGGGGAEEDGGSSDDGEVVFEDCHEDHEWAAAAADEKGGGAAAAAAREAVMVAA